MLFWLIRFNYYECIFFLGKYSFFISLTKTPLVLILIFNVFSNNSIIQKFNCTASNFLFFTIKIWNFLLLMKARVKNKENVSSFFAKKFPVCLWGFFFLRTLLLIAFQVRNLINFVINPASSPRGLKKRVIAKHFECSTN